MHSTLSSKLFFLEIVPSRLKHPGGFQVFAAGFYKRKRRVKENHEGTRAKESSGRIPSLDFNCSEWIAENFFFVSPTKASPPFSLRVSLIKDGVSPSLIRISKELNGATRREQAVGRERRRANSRAAGENRGEKQQVGEKKEKNVTMKEKEVVLSKSTAGGDN